MIHFEPITQFVPKIVGLVIFAFGLAYAIRGLAYRVHLEKLNERVEAGEPIPRYIILVRYLVGAIGAFGLTFFFDFSSSNNVLVTMALIYFILVGALAWRYRNYIPRTKLPNGLFAARLGYLGFSFVISTIGLGLLLAPLTMK